MDISRPSSSSSGLGRGGSLCSTNGCADNGRPNSVSSSASASSQSPFGTTVEQLMGSRSVSAAANAAASLSNASAFSSVGGGGGSFASFNPFFFPFMPYAVGGASPISGFWPYAFPATTGDYFLQMATLFGGRNQQSAGAGAAAAAATGSAAAASVLEESFPEILHRLSKAASGNTEQTTVMQACSSSSSPNAAASTAAAESSPPPVVEQAAASFWTKGESSSSSSSTSGAGSLVQKSQTGGSGQPRGKQRQQSAGDKRRADEQIDFSNPKRRGESGGKPKSPDEQVMTTSTSNGGSTTVGDEPTSTSTTGSGGGTGGGKRFAVSPLDQQNIFNASAAAWAALSNQILLTNLQTGLFTGGLGAAANPVQQAAEPPPAAVTVASIASTDDRATSASTTLPSTMTSPSKRTTTTTLEPEPETPTRASGARQATTGGGRRAVSSRRGRTPTASRRGAAGRGRPATISSNDTRRPASSASTLDPKETNRSSVDDTIDDVASGQPRSPAALSQFYFAFSSLDHFMNPNAYAASASSAGRSGPGRPRRRAGRGSRGGITVRQQLAMMKRAGVGSTTAAVGNKASPQAQPVGIESTDANVVDTATTTTTTTTAALDLRTKSNKATPTQQHADLSSSGIQRATNGHLDNNLMEKNLAETTNRKRVVNPKLLRNPILCGWRRQTVIRHISASGIRGDVLYYAPCGKRLGSYVEVMRYLRKNGIINLTKEDFSFSSKIIVGEFVCNRRDSLKSGLVNLSESDVLNLLSQLKNNGSGGSLPSSMKNSPNDGANDSLSRRSKRVTTALVRKSSVTKATTQRRKLEFKQSDGERGRVRNLKAQQKLKKQQNQQEAPAVKRVVAKAAAVMREEQKLLKNNEKEVKVRQVRVPVEDTEVEHAKPLPEFTPVKHLQLDSSAFADLLMVMQFVTTFGHVLNIKKSDIPSLATMHAGLLNNPPDQQAVVNLTKTLLSLLLEYSNLPTGASAICTCTGVTLKDETVTDANYSELLRLFFTSRDDPSCLQLSNSLESNSFEAVDPSVKVRMLAYMCNDLLYCRNVVREVESNIEELAKLKSDKWSKKGKIRALRLARAAKVGEQQQKKVVVVGKDQKSDESAVSELGASSAEKYDPNAEANNNQQLHNCDESTKDDLKSEQQQQQQQGGGEPGHSGALFESELTPEEKQMSPEEIDKMIDTLSKEVDQMRCKISNRGLKIRSLPLGQDRLRRNYWMINEIRGILVQSVESGSNTVETDVRDCVTALRDAVVALMNDDHHHKVSIAENDAIEADDRQLKSAYAKASAPAGGGGGGGDSCCWWIIDQPSKVDELLQSLSQRGIRERLFSRSLAKYSDTYKECAFGDKSAIELTPTIRRSGPSFVEQMMTVLTAMQQLEDKCYQANIHVPGWHPEEGGEYNNNNNYSAESELSLLNNDNGDILALVKARLLNLEKNIERRYLTPFINHNEAKMFQSNSSRAKLSSKGNDGSSEDLPAQIVHWRQGVDGARSAAQFHMCMDALESFVAWEKSIMKAMCQICRDDCNESQLLLCDGCDMGYHTYCFRPKMTKVPEEDWYCPECVAKATRRSCCLVCCRHSSQPMLACAECGREYHAECVDLDPVKSVKSNWRCFGCCKLRKSLSNGPSAPKRRKLEPKEKRRPVESSNKKSPNKKVVKSEKKKQQAEKKAASNSGSPTTATTAVTYSGFDYEEICSIILAELDAHRDSWPFKKPVDSKLVPLYKKVIKKPMDLSAIHAKLISHKYQRGEDFVKDVNLVFDNCKTFNEDDSKIGKAGHSLRRFFTRRWKELHAATQLKRF